LLNIVVYYFYQIKVYTYILLLNIKNLLIKNNGCELAEVIKNSRYDKFALAV